MTNQPLQTGAAIVSYCFPIVSYCFPGFVWLCQAASSTQQGLGCFAFLARLVLARPRADEGYQDRI